MILLYFVFFFKQKTAYEMRISDWSSDVCSSDLRAPPALSRQHRRAPRGRTPENAGPGPAGDFRQLRPAMPAVLPRQRQSVRALSLRVNEIFRSEERRVGNVCQYV